MRLILETWRYFKNFACEKVYCSDVNSSWSWWRHHMETFSALLALCVGNSPVTGEFPVQGPVTLTQSFDVSFICAWMNGRVNNRDFGHHRGHHDVIVMILQIYATTYYTFTDWILASYTLNLRPGSITVMVRLCGINNYMANQAILLS